MAAVPTGWAPALAVLRMKSSNSASVVALGERALGTEDDALPRWRRHEAGKALDRLSEQRRCRSRIRGTLGQLAANQTDYLSQA